MFVGAVESQTSWRKHRWWSWQRRRRRMWRRRRRSGYGRTAIQQIIIGFVRQHLLCQHSSRQPRGGRARKPPAEFRETDTKTDRNKARHRKAKALRSLWSSPSCLCEQRVWSSSLRVRSSNPRLPCCSVLDQDGLPSGWPWPLTLVACPRDFTPDYLVKLSVFLFHS